MDTHPYYRRSLPKFDNPPDPGDFSVDRIDLTNAHIPPYPKPDASGALPDSRPSANLLFDARAAAAVISSVRNPLAVRITPRSGDLDLDALLQIKNFGDSGARGIYILTSKCLALMAYGDYFPKALFGPGYRHMVSQAIMRASPGWCGSMGPGVTGFISVIAKDALHGDYDMTQMFLLPLAYSYYDELGRDAQDRLITLLLAGGRIQRPGEDDTFTSGGAPNDWSRAGHINPLGLLPTDIPETENHVLMIATARYLTNQLLYQRSHDPKYDNRRNGDSVESRPNCMDQVLGLLRNELRNDFAEYNAKNYQEQTRHALLNLCSYAYDAEVRLGARMVLDYISAHIAVSSNDLRRMVPFRRLSEEINVREIKDEPGFMDVSLLDTHGADPMPAHFALLAGNTRAYQVANWRQWVEKVDGTPTTLPPSRPWSWAITPNFDSELVLGALSNYRLPPSIHDLFVNDSHRRFFQRLHRHPLEEPGQQRNCDNMEIYAGSPSYLITAGGRPAIWVIPGKYVGESFLIGNLGVAVPTSFMPTGLSAGRSRNILTLKQLADLVDMSALPVSLRVVAQALGISVPFSWRQELSASAASHYASPNDAIELIQFSHFSNDPEFEIGFVRVQNFGGTENYGVAPDFACGYRIHKPRWVTDNEIADGQFTFVDKKAKPGGAELAGFFLAIHEHEGFALLEAFDTWLHPEVTFEDFRNRVKRANGNLFIENNREVVYTTQNGNQVHFVIWNNSDRDNHVIGSKILKIDYGTGNPADTHAAAGDDTDSFLRGTILNSLREAVVEITNSFLRTTLTLDWSNPLHLVRTSEDGEVEEAGNNNEVWVDFDWTGPFEGDFFRPFNTISAAADAVADGGVIKIMRGTTSERRLTNHHKRIRLVAPIGGVNIGGR
jgi:hypothetical protein